MSAACTMCAMWRARRSVVSAKPGEVGLHASGNGMELPFTTLPISTVTKRTGHAHTPRSRGARATGRRRGVLLFEGSEELAGAGMPGIGVQCVLEALGRLLEIVTRLGDLAPVGRVHWRVTGRSRWRDQTLPWRLAHPCGQARRTQACTNPLRAGFLHVACGATRSQPRTLTTVGFVSPLGGT